MRTIRVSLRDIPRQVRTDTAARLAKYAPDERERQALLVAALLPSARRYSVTITDGDRLEDRARQLFAAELPDAGAWAELPVAVRDRYLCAALVESL